MESLPPLVSIDCALALSGSVTTSGATPYPRVELARVDAPIGGVSREDPLLFDTEEEASTRMVRHDTRLASKRRLSWLDSLQA